MGVVIGKEQMAKAGEIYWQVDKILEGVTIAAVEQLDAVLHTAVPPQGSFASLTNGLCGTVSISEP